MDRTRKRRNYEIILNADVLHSTFCNFAENEKSLSEINFKGFPW